MSQVWYMDQGWLFYRGELVVPPVTDKSQTYDLAKSENGNGPAAWDYAEAGWEQVSLPHDYCVQQDPDPKGSESQGYLRRDPAWYRRYFRMPCGEYRRCFLLFERLGTAADIWVNGHAAEHTHSLHTEVIIDISDYVDAESINVVAVHITNPRAEGWYYEGCGLIGHVRLIFTDNIFIEPHGIFVYPVEREGGWETLIETKLRNNFQRNCQVQLHQTLLDPEGCAVCHCTERLCLCGETSVTVKQVLLPEHVFTWDLDQARQYTLHTQLEAEGVIYDVSDTLFGYRTSEFSAEVGFLLNGKKTKLKGVCIHNHHGKLGYAIPDSLHEYRIRQLQSMGCNAIRTTHYPPTESFLECCDRLGMLVMPELRDFNATKEGISQLRSMVLEARNHPCVILWCIGNEEAIATTRTGRRIMHRLKRELKQLDPFRPVTTAMNAGFFMPENAALECDVIGVNYNTDRLDQIHEVFPDKGLVCTEVYSTADDPHAGNRRQGLYDWRQVEARPFVAGLFIWTGFDYRGEHFWPRTQSALGALDQNAMPKSDYMFYKRIWKENQDSNLAEADVFLSDLSYDDVSYIELRPWYQDIPADGETILVIDLYARDRQGKLVHSANMQFSVETEGNLMLVNCNNPNVMVRPYLKGNRESFYEGKAQILLRAGSLPGGYQVTVRADGFDPVSTKGELVKANSRMQLPTAEGMFRLRRMGMSDFFGESNRPDLEKLAEHFQLADSPLAFWAAIMLDGHPQETIVIHEPPGYVLYGAVVTPPYPDEEQITMVIPEICGRAYCIVAQYEENGRKTISWSEKKELEEPGKIQVFMHGFDKEKKVVIWLEITVHDKGCGVLAPIEWYKGIR